MLSLCQPGSSLTGTIHLAQVCRQIGSDPLCELWYSAGFRGISGRIGDYRSPTGIICAIGPGFGLMQNVQAMCRACGDVRTLLRKANRSAIDFLGIQEDFLGVKKYFAFGDRLEARMRSHNEDSKTARRHMSITEDVDIFLPQCGRTGRRLEPGMTPVQAGIGYNTASIVCLQMRCIATNHAADTARNQKTREIPSPHLSAKALLPMLASMMKCSSSRQATASYKSTKPKGPFSVC